MRLQVTRNRPGEMRNEKRKIKNEWKAPEMRNEE
jgi:hypothetical protein